MTIDTPFIDTHTHLDGEEFLNDLPEVIERAREAGISHVFLPAIDAKTCGSVLDVCRRYRGFAYPMLGLHPEEVRENWREELAEIRNILEKLPPLNASDDVKVLAIGEVGLDYYWSRDYAEEQLLAFEEQVRWSVETRLPLMIHCRKAQNELVKVLRRYEKDLPGGVFHCFTGNAIEAEELLSFERFVLGIGGVATFKKSHLPEVLPQTVPLSRIVLETDSPYMAPVPHRGERNESAFVKEVLLKLADAYGVSANDVAQITTENVHRVFEL